MSTDTTADAPTADGMPAEGSAPKEHWFARLGRFSARRRRPLMLFWLIAALAAAPLAITVNSSLSGAGWEAQGSIAQRVRDELRTNFSQVGAEAAVVVVHQNTPITHNPGAVQAIVQALTDAPAVKAVADPLTMPAAAGLISQDGMTALVPVELAARNDAQRPRSAGFVIERVASLSLWGTC